ncbi:hypothetical protein MMC25_006426 [Agyrium rufum]|nr:hypothetical protein [Agyrium rufum]
MPEKRRMSTRSRIEPLVKKRALTPPPPPLPPTPVRVATPSPVLDRLPLRITVGEPLPTCAVAQPSNLSTKAYQTIQESGILANSILRSRQKWLSGEMFERYWMKGAKKKGAPEVNNPPRETMVKFGTCSMVAEPHTLDLILYIVKDITSKSTAPSVPANFRQDGHGTVAWQNEVYHNPVPAQAQSRPVETPVARPLGQIQSPQVEPPKLAPHPVISPAQGLPTFDKHFARLEEPIQPAPAPRPLPPASVTPSDASHMTPPSTQAHPGNPPRPIYSEPEVQPKDDPVIQMLASRASADPALKELMTDVAAGTGTAAQLRTFQRHIDELNRIIHGNKKAKARQKSGHQESRHTGPSNHSTTYPGHQPHASPANESSNRNPFAPPTIVPQSQIPPYSAVSSQPYIKTEPRMHTPSSIQAIPKHKASSTYNRQEPTAIVFEFVGGNGDRYLFPKYSIVESPHNLVMIASFIVIEREILSEGSGKEPNFVLEEYRPISVRLTATDARILEKVGKVIAPREEAIKHMNEIMDRTSRAQIQYLPMRLPRTNETPTNEETKPTVKGEEVATPKPMYPPPSYLRPLEA